MVCIMYDRMERYTIVVCDYVTFLQACYNDFLTCVTLASAGISCRPVSVCLSQAQELLFPDAENLGKIQMGPSPTARYVQVE